MFEGPSCLFRGPRGASAAAVGFALTVLGGMAFAQQDKYTVQVPNGLAFFQRIRRLANCFCQSQRSAWSDRGDLRQSRDDRRLPDGRFGERKAVPGRRQDGEIHWNPKKSETAPGPTTVPGTQHDVDFMVKDSKRFADSGGWGYAFFKYDAASDTFTPATSADRPPQGNDAKCGLACHSIVKTRDYVFTEYGHR